VGAAGGRWVGLLLVVLVSLTGCSTDSSVAPPKPPADSTDHHEASAQRTLTGLVDALASRSSEKATELATPAARSVLEAMVANVATLDLTDLAIRYVDDQNALSDSDRDLYGADAWAATAELTYRVSGWDAQPTRVETRFVLVSSGTRDLVAGVGGGDDRTPLWLTGRVTRLATARALVITTGKLGQRYLGLARQALVDVGKVLPDWHGRLVVEGPASETELDQALAAPQDRYANIAAVTTTVDGSLVPGSPVHVFLNPRVFDSLGPRGSQVVVSHETTHVATNATFADVPTWLLEGFADYVALAHANIPVKTAASQILARIRKNGPPDHLPTAADLDPSATGLGATYEEAWLATRFIARQYGEDKLVRFYRRVSAGEDVAAGFRTILGTSLSAFEKRWRADLRDLAGGLAG
jgi:hypothetical protein